MDCVGLGWKRDGVCWGGEEERWRILSWGEREIEYVGLGRKRDGVSPTYKYICMHINVKMEYVHLESLTHSMSAQHIFASSPHQHTLGVNPEIQNEWIACWVEMGYVRLSTCSRLHLLYIYMHAYIFICWIHSISLPPPHLTSSRDGISWAVRWDYSLGVCIYVFFCVCEGGGRVLETCQRAAAAEKRGTACVSTPDVTGGSSWLRWWKCVYLSEHIHMYIVTRQLTWRVEIRNLSYVMNIWMYIYAYTQRPDTWHDGWKLVT